MRALVLFIALLCSLVISVSAVTMCPFDEPQTFGPGSFTVDSSIAGTVVGFLTGSEGYAYSDAISGVTYSSLIQTVGRTTYGSQTIIGKTLTSSKALEQNGGSASMGEDYFQAAISKTNLSYCDSAVGGSYFALESGQVASETMLNVPVDLSYNVAVSGLNNNLATGMGSVYLSAYSKEGSNATLLATSTYKKSYITTGMFEFASSDTVRITHPASSNYAALKALIPAPVVTPTPTPKPKPKPKPC